MNGSSIFSLTLRERVMAAVASGLIPARVNSDFPGFSKSAKCNSIPSMAMRKNGRLDGR